MAGEIFSCTVVGVDDTYRGETLNIATIAAPTNTKIASFPGPAVANPLAERMARLPREIEEANHWSTTQQEVDTYIDSLEHGLWQGCEYGQERRGKEYKRAASINDRLSISSTLFWGVVAIAAGCFWWLAKIILEAVD